MKTAWLAKFLTCKDFPHSTDTDVRTVPYEGDNFANYKMDNFSLIFINFLKTDWYVFYVNAKNAMGSIFKGKKDF